MANQGPAGVVLEGVRKVFPGGLEALRDVNLLVEPGEFLVLVGPSGCGKTTTLRLIAGLEEPTAGQIRIGGLAAENLPPRQRNVGLVFQKGALYPNRTVLDNLKFGLKLRPWSFRGSSSQEEENVGRLIRLLGLEDILDRYPQELSAGQQQRVSLGRVLVRQPGVILLDEPLGHLDLPLRLELRRQLHLLHRQFPATIIHVTHDPLEALALGDRLAVLGDGVIQQADRPEKIHGRPANRRVAEIISGPRGPMNFLDGCLVLEDGKLEFAGKGGRIGVGFQREQDWRSWAGKEVTLGIRPEDVVLNGNQSGAGVIPMEVCFIESQGDSFLVTCRASDWQLTGWSGNKFPLVSGQTVMVAIGWPKVLLFARGGGQELISG